MYQTIWDAVRRAEQSGWTSSTAPAPRSVRRCCGPTRCTISRCCPPRRAAGFSGGVVRHRLGRVERPDSTFTTGALDDEQDGTQPMERFLSHHTADDGRLLLEESTAAFRLNPRHERHAVELGVPVGQRVRVELRDDGGHLLDSLTYVAPPAG